MDMPSKKPPKEKDIHSSPNYMEQIDKIQQFAETELQSLLKKEFPIIIQADDKHYQINGDRLTVYSDHVKVTNIQSGDITRFNFKKLAFFYILARNQCKMEDCQQIKALDIQLVSALNDSVIFKQRFKQFLAKGDGFKCQLYISRLQESKLLLNILSQRAAKYARLAKYQKGHTYETGRF